MGVFLFSLIRLMRKEKSWACIPESEEVLMKKRILILALAAIVILTTGCSPKKQAVEEPFAALTDQTGRKVLIEKVPDRIISLSPSNTEIAFSIGLGKKIVGVTDYCNYPEEALAKRKIGGYANPNLEAIIALKPNLVLAGDKHDDIVKKLGEMGIPALIIIPTSLEEVYASMELVAAATGSQEIAAGVIADMKERVQKIQEKLATVPEGKRPRVYYEVYSKPLISAGNLSVIHEVITLAGGKNIFMDISERFPKISDEAVVERDPQVILYSKQHGSEEITGDVFVKRPVWGKITAVKEGRIYGIQADAISRPGPRLIDAVEEVAVLLYPN